MMKKFCFLFVFFAALAVAQSTYQQIPDRKINAERLRISEKFIQEFIVNCAGKNYADLKNFNMTKRMELRYKESYTESCKKSQNYYGKIDLLGFNSAYTDTTTLNSDPLELYIYEVLTEKLPDVKYVSVWMYRDKNYINSIWISREKPMNYKAKKTE